MGRNRLVRAVQRVNRPDWAPPWHVAFLVAEARLWCGVWQHGVSACLGRPEGLFAAGAFEDACGNYTSCIP